MFGYEKHGLWTGWLFFIPAFSGALSEPDQRKERGEYQPFLVVFSRLSANFLSVFLKNRLNGIKNCISVITLKISHLFLCFFFSVT